VQKKIYFPFIFAVLSVFFASGQQAVLSGYLKLDTGWVKKIFICRISDFNTMFTASDKLIVAESSIDSTGFFQVQIPSAKEEALYRMHIIRKNDPVSTLIIGSEFENHVFFIANDSSHIYFKSPEHSRKMEQGNISGDVANQELNSVLMAMHNSGNRDSLKNQLVATTENARSELVGLFAAYSSFGLNGKQKNRIGKALVRYQKNNPYGNRIFEEYKNRGNDLLLVIFVLIVFPVAGWFGYGAYKKRRTLALRQSLSQRETNIARLILDGRTNKEIALELNIEVSTVKTHVNNMYAKLKVGSRRELLRYREIFGSKEQQR
jgi:DNA-binding CsgD family transcriptional regulator